MLFWCFWVGYAAFYSHCILVEDTGIPVTLLACREIPGQIPQFAALHLLRESTVPKAINFPLQFKAQENCLELVCCSKSFMKDELLGTWEFVFILTQRCDGSCENNCSSPEEKQCCVWAAAAWAREAERNHSRTGEAPKMPFSYLWPFGQTPNVSTHDIRQSCF